MLKVSKVSFASLLIALSLGGSIANAQGRFVGYFANNGYIPENQDHTTVNHIWAGYADRNTATSVILQELAQAKAHGIKSIVSVESFVFNGGTSGNMACPYRVQPNAANYWNTFVNALIANGYLVPNNPSASTVAAFYPVDEPELCSLNDSGGQPHSALVHAINTIRNHPSTSGFPIAVLASKKYGSALQGIKLFDWAGLDNYSVNTTDYLSQFAVFESKLAPQQRSILVPQAATGGFMRDYGAWHQPQPIIDRFLSNQRIIGLIPFLWGHHDTTGVRSIPELREAYTGIGRHIKTGAPLPMQVSLSCFGDGGFFECQAQAQRGVPPYSYTWNTAQGYGDYAIYHLPCGIQHQAIVTVTDSVGSQKSVQSTLYCHPGTDPR